MRYVLNLGAGSAPFPLQGVFPSSEWEEIRIDADPAAKPHVVADMRKLPLGDGFADAIVCLGVLEHFEEPSLPVVFGEMKRVLCGGGQLKLLVPDMQALAVEIANGRLNDTLFESPAGPVRALDIVYGYSPMLVEHPLWGHRVGFTGDTLAGWLSVSGFEGSVGTSEAAPYMLLADARKK